MTRLSITGAALFVVLYLGATASQPHRSPASDATAQVADLLILDGDTLGILTNPLESFFDEEHPRPDEIFPEGCSITACWRGYQAIWQITGDVLYLIALEDCCSDARLSASALDSLLDGRFKEGKARADWYTGRLIIPIGKMVEYVHMGYGSTYDGYIILRIEEGVMTKKWEADERQFRTLREAQFEHFKQTETYATVLARLSKGDKRNEERVISFIYDYYSGEYMAMIFDE